jgi:WD40 repeat protein/tRNA A-37 threonylcarbamoyl transferase component Bud32
VFANVNPSPDGSETVFDLAFQLERFEAVWRTGKRPALLLYLPAKGHSRGPEALFELAGIDLDHRLRMGDEAPLVQCYFCLGGVELSAEQQVALIRQEYLLRWQRGEVGGTRATYQRLFPEHSSALQQLKPLCDCPNPDCKQEGIELDDEAATTVTCPRCQGRFPPFPPTQQPPVVDSTQESSPAEWPTPPGHEILQEVGRGGMGIVYKARQIGLQRMVALKMIRAGGLAIAEELQRFRDEAKLVAALQHPNIVRIYEVGEHNGVPFFSLEFCPGSSLDKRLAGTPLPPKEAAGLIETLARAVQAAHCKHIVHRDLKPANVLYAEDGTPKITDFGVAKKLDEAGQTGTYAVMGTPSYMAPEQASGKSKGVGPCADVWALGAILFECLTGRPPFKAATALDTMSQVVHHEPVPPSRLNAQVPRDLETICLMCLHKDPTRRYLSAAALAEDLRRFQTGEPILARPVGLGERLVKWVRRRPTAAALLGVSVVASAVLLVLVVGLFFYRQLKESFEEVEKYRHQAELLSTDLALQRGLGLCEQGEISRGLLWLARALKLAPDHATDLQLAVRSNLAGWCRQIHPLLWASAHQGPVLPGALAFSPDGTIIVTGSEDHTACLWEAATGTRLRTLPHGGLVTAVAFSPDGKTVLTGSTDKAARLWDITTGEVRHCFVGHGGAVWDVAFSPDAKAVLTGSEDHSARLWDTETGKQLKQFDHKGVVQAAAFSPKDSNTILTGSHDKTARLWQASTGKLLQVLQHQDAVWCVAFSPNGKTLATGSHDKTARLWEADTGKPVGEPLQHQGWVRHLAFSGPDGTLLATAGWDGVAQLWETATGHRHGAPLRHGERVLSVAFSRDGKNILTGSADGVAQLWDVNTGNRVGAPLPHRDAVVVAFSPDGKTLLTASRDHTVRLWDAGTGPRLERLLSHRGPVVAVAVSRDGKRLLTGSMDTNAYLWDAESHQIIGSALAHSNTVNAVAFSPDGQIAVTASQGRARLWEAGTGRPLRDLPLPDQDSVFAVAFAPDGKRLLTGGLDGKARCWELATGNELDLPLKHDRVISAVAFSPDGKVVATASDDRTVRLWKTTTAQIPPLWHDGEVWALAFRPSGKALATGSLDGNARLWDVDTGKPLGTPLRHQGAVRAVAFSPAGKILATARPDGTARLWNAVTSEQFGLLPHHGQVYDVAFSSDGKTVVTGSGDGTARLWDVGTGKPLGTPLQHQGAVRAVAFGSDGKSILTGSFDNYARQWRIPLPVEGELERIRLWVQVLTSMELDDTGIVHVLDAATWENCRLQLEIKGGPPR